MALRIETPMALQRPVEAAAEKVRELDRQGLNAPAMKHDEDAHVEQQLQRAQAAEEAEGRHIQAEEKKRGQTGEGDSEVPEDASGTDAEEPAEDRMETLKREASRRILDLPVEPKRKEGLEQRRLDITL